MRMRKKKHLDTRLLECQDNLLIIKPNLRDFSRTTGQEDYINFQNYFGNSQDISIEIGCGKGSFICELAKQSPDKNFVAVEKVSNVIVSAAETAKKRGIKNILFICVGAEYLGRYIKPNTVETLYLNFSCPYPKNKHASHRLTAQNFLKIYKQILKKDAHIEFKTDNRQLFEFSIEQMSDFGITLKNVTLDLHNSKFAEDNIITEYESRFIAQNLPIYRLEGYLTHIEDLG